MKKRFSTFVFPGVLVLGALALFLPEVVLHPATHVLSQNGDGLKNYFTQLYQLRFGTDLTWFHGMNHPFGEHVIFTDGQMAWVWIYRMLGLGHLSIGADLAVMHWLLWLELALSAGILLRCLTLLEVPRTIAFLSALSLTLMTPQIVRLAGHYALAHALPLPLAIYLHLLRWRALARGESGWKYSAALSANAIFWGWVHPYLLIILCFLSLALEMSRVLTSAPARSRPTRVAGQIFLQGLLPFLVFQVFLRLTDPTSDRAVAASGFEFASNFRGVFFASYADILATMGSTWRDLLREPYEKTVAVSGWTLPLMLPVLVFTLRRRKSVWPAFFIAGFTCLILSFGFPLRQFPELMFPAVRQFRALGRVAWCFYYLFGFLVAGFLGSLYRRGGRRLAAVALVIASSQLIESTHWLWRHSIELHDGISAFRMPDDSEVAGITVADYQAILPLPVFHVGSEGPDLRYEDESARQGFLLALKTGIPLMGHHGSRSSVSQARLLVGSIEGTADPAPLVIRLKTDPRNILVMQDDNAGKFQVDPSVSRRVGKIGRFTLFSVSPEKLLPLQTRQ